MLHEGRQMWARYLSRRREVERRDRQDRRCYLFSRRTGVSCAVVRRCAARRRRGRRSRNSCSLSLLLLLLSLFTYSRCRTSRTSVTAHSKWTSARDLALHAHRRVLRAQEQTTLLLRISIFHACIFTTLLVLLFTITTTTVSQSQRLTLTLTLTRRHRPPP